MNFLDFTVFFVFVFFFSPSTFSFAWFFFCSFIMIVYLRGVCSVLQHYFTSVFVFVLNQLCAECVFFSFAFVSIDVVLWNFVNLCKCAFVSDQMSWKQTAGENWKKSRSRSSSKSKLTQTAVAHTSKTNNSERLSKPFSLREIVVQNGTK